jgi:hypothetical protein
MDAKSFILSLLETPVGHLNWNDREFLSQIVEGSTSAYTMHKRHEEEYQQKKLSDPDNAKKYKPLAYININKRFRKYHRLGLLEEEIIDGGYAHGARNYNVSEKGFVFLFLDVIHPNIYEMFRNFSQSKLFQTFILPYFESKTIEHYTISLTKFIEYYLENICNKINNALNPELLEQYQYNTKLPLSQQFDFINDDPYDLLYATYPISNLLIQLETAHKSLILDLVSMNDEILTNRVPYPTEKDKIKTIQLLSKDKIFINEFKKIKIDIDNSYNKLLNV